MILVGDRREHRQQRRLAGTIYARSRQRPLSVVTAPVASGKSEILGDIASLAAADGVAASCFTVRDGDAEDACQFERLGYFVPDRVDSTAARPVLNRIATLRDTWQR